MSDNISIWEQSVTKSGVSMLDVLLPHGLPRNSFVMMGGEAGTGKSALVAELAWKTDEIKSRPDRWTIERKVDVDTDSFSLIGVSYINEEFFDRNIEFNTSYIYRIKSLDIIGRESKYFEVGLTV